MNAISLWESKTQLRFRELSNQEFLTYYTYNPNRGPVPPYIAFRSGNGSSSPVGMLFPGPNSIIIDEGSGTVGTVVHEIGHSIGFIHEHQNTFRDNQIIIHTGNIQQNKMHNFTKENRNQSVYGGIDFYSIMLYPSYNSFAIDITQPTMSAKSNITIPTKAQTGINNNTWIAQRSFISVNDRWAVAGVYGYYFNPEDHKFEEGGRFWDIMP